MKKLIETALPLSEINRKTIGERTSAIGHPGNLHMWWGRSPRYSSTIALLSSVIDASDDEEELVRRMGRLKNDEMRILEINRLFLIHSQDLEVFRLLLKNWDFRLLPEI